MSEVRLRVNAPQVIHETIDGEVIIINLGTGTYYSVKGSGAVIWDLIQRTPTASAEEIAAATAAAFAQDRAAVEPDVHAFVASLQAEELLVEAPADAEPPAAAAPAGEAAAGPFEPPALEKYTDMQDLVLLDPVHEVDAAGWPQARPEAPAVEPAA